MKTKIQPSDLKLICPQFFIRSFTNDNERAKQYFTAIKSEKYESGLIIEKLVLSKNWELYNEYKMIKKFKGYYLFRTTFSIKIETLKTVMNILN